MKRWTDPDGTLHEIYTGHVFVGKEYLGSFPYDSGRADIGYCRSGLAYFCPHCGEIWARIAAENSRGEAQQFILCTLACERHPDQWNLPGSLITHSHAALFDSFPPAAVAREFRLHMENYLRK